MISAKESTPKPPSQSVFSLPPPCSYEDLYSSYQNEWEQQKKSKDDLNKEFAAIAPDIDEFISGLEWVVLPGDSGSDVFLLACTGSGEILVWKLAESTEDETNGAADNNNNNSSSSSSSNNNNPDPAMLLKRHTRCRICLGSEEDGIGCDDDDDRDSKALHGICVVKLATTANGEEGKNKQRGRKRQRPSNGDEKQQQVVLIVAGEGGLWSIPLLDVLKQPWESTSQELPSSLLRLSSRAVQKVQTSPSECEGPQRLFVLERDTNTLAIWNLSVVLEAHATKSSDTIGPTYETKIDLSRIFSGASADNSSKSKKQRRIQTRLDDCSEHATVITVIPSLAANDRSDGLALLVGTDRSRLWILPVPSGDDKATEQKPYFLSLHDEKKNSCEEMRGFSGRQTASETEWSVTGVVATNGGTWWTVAAALATKSSNNDNTGLLVTWHAPTGMVVARQETREAIQAILNDDQLYSAANERAITVWDSSFGLKRSGRFWASPPSSKALAILASNIETAKSVMAVAGVGDKVDLFVDHCRVQTMRI